MDARAVQADAAAVTRRLELGHARRVKGIEPADRCDDVRARLEQPHDLVERGEQGTVDHAVGAEGDERVDVVGREQADRTEAAELADVAAGLGGAVDPGADQLELAMREDAFDGGPADVAGRPLDHAIGHGGRSSSAARSVASGGANE